MRVLFIYLLTIFTILGCATPGPVDAPAMKADVPKAEAQPPVKVQVPSPAPVVGRPPVSVSSIYLDTAGRPAGKGDPANPVSEAIRIGRGFHPQALQDAKLPKDRYGLVDWAKLVKENIITPKEGLETTDEEPPLEMDVVIEAKSGFVNDVVFPHGIHTYWVKCDVCHDKIFMPAKGENKMSMAGIVEGKWCGRCHSKVAFPLSDCARCHVKVKEKQVG